MKGKVLSWFVGSLKITIKGCCCERFFNLCAYHGIVLWKLKPLGDNEFTAGILLKNFRKIRPLAKKCHVRIQIVKKSGFPFFCLQCRKRKPLFFSAAMAFALLFALSLFIWDIRIEGNREVTDEQITDYLTGQGIVQGRLKNSVDYKELASSLRAYFPELTWVSVKLEGTRLLIQLQENADPILQEEGEYGPSDLVSDVEGTVTRIITRSGTPAVKAGDQVKKGDLLVSGRVELVNDAAEVYGYQYTAADADVYVLSATKYQDEVSFDRQEKVYSGGETSRILLKFGSFSLGIPFFEIPYKQYDTVKEDRQLRLMENFYLPVYFSKITVREYETIDKTWTFGQAKARLEANLENFLKKIQEKGVQIFQNDVKIETADSLCRACGTIYLIEKAGRRVLIEEEPLTPETESE